ncbi:FAD-binding oxidoreductase [Rhodococcus sovatensis]|uniref:FAD-linked oxidase C-terminal domain-containing protein n=1 Tax=Rhodococcus sovatensis TaxID=1805840 RepID=A0ABZ2PIJ1_9NOCA
MTPESAMLRDTLSANLGDAVTYDRDVMSAFHRDQSRLTAAGQPAALVRARSVQDVVTTMTSAYAQGIPVVARGAGTGLAGAANALDGCIVLSLEAMNRILDIDPHSRTATVQSGVLNGALAAAASKVGLWYVPDPGSRAISTIGGNVATNAGGSCCAKYGVTGDHVARIKAVMADGRIIHTGANTRKNVAGLNLTQLLVGSEGTLGVIVEATVRLRVQPNAASTVVASFAEPSEAIAAVLEITRESDPCLVEIMDRTTISAVDELTHMGLDTHAGALLLVQCDGRDAANEAELCAQACNAAGATEVYATDDRVEGDEFMHARRMVLPALERLGGTLLDDLAVPVDKLPAMLTAIERTARSHEVLIGTFGHAADGNLHPTIIFDDNSPDETRRARCAFDDMVLACLDLGGSISGEHGIGVLKLPHLEAMVGTVERDIMARIKKALDPKDILNPGRAI